jgi:hypothetical protein
MIDEYYRNGLQALSKLTDLELQDEAAINKFVFHNDFIKQYYKKPIQELASHSIIGDASSENELLKALRKYFEVSSKTRSVLDSLMRSEHGRCSYCGVDGDVLPNRSFIFPFERKIDSITPENSRLVFCKKCAIIFYSAMSNYFAKGPVLGFFFDSYNTEALSEIVKRFKELKDRNTGFIAKTPILSYHRHETLFLIIYMFVKHIKDSSDEKLELIAKRVNQVNMVINAGYGQIYNTEKIDGNILEKIVYFFEHIITESEEMFGRLERKPPRLNPKDLIMSGFFGNLNTHSTKIDVKFAYRDKFTSSLLRGKINFVILNDIIMNRIRNKDKIGKIVFPRYYNAFIRNYYKVFDMQGQELFFTLNRIGQDLGSKIKGTNLESFIWNLYRARGFEELLGSLTELQLKVQEPLDISTIYQHKDDWKMAKAILINGIANSIYSGVKQK